LVKDPLFISIYNRIAINAKTSKFKLTEEEILLEAYWQWHEAVGNQN